MPVKSFDEATSIHFSTEQIVEDEYRNKHIECLGDLIEILENELKHYSILVSMLLEQRKCFAEGNMVSFEDINKRQGTMILKIKTLEEARKSVISQLSQWLGVTPEKLNLSGLADLMDEPYKGQLIILREDIKSTIKNLENIKESNAYLVQHALHYVSGVLRIFASSQSQNLRYSNDGQLEQDQGKGKYVSGWG